MVKGFTPSDTHARAHAHTHTHIKRSITPRKCSVCLGFVEEAAESATLYLISLLPALFVVSSCSSQGRILGKLGHLVNFTRSRQVATQETQ